MNRTTHGTAREERGQILVIFALAITAIIAMVGLVLDGSGAFAQRRFEQNAADLAALAGANAYMNTPGNTAPDLIARKAAAISAARASATQNGYTDGTDGTALTVDVTKLSSGAEVKVGVTDPHQNSFARIVPGQEAWNVSVTASAGAYVIDTGVAAAPWTMHIDAFIDGRPKYDKGHPQSFGSECGDYPVNDLDLSWTDFNGANNVNSAEVKRILDGTNVVTSTIQFGQYVGQHNQGCHTTLFDDTDAALAGTNVPVPIVGPPTAPATTCTSPSSATNGCFKGWAMFHVTSASGGSNKVIRGYFLENFRTKPLTVGECTPVQEAAGTCGTIITTSPFDNYVVVLTD